MKNAKTQAPAHHNATRPGINSSAPTISSGIKQPSVSNSQPQHAASGAQPASHESSVRLRAGFCERGSAGAAPGGA